MRMHTALLKPIVGGVNSGQMRQHPGSLRTGLIISNVSSIKFAHLEQCFRDPDIKTQLVFFSDQVAQSENGPVWCN